MNGTGRRLAAGLLAAALLGPASAAEPAPQADARQTLAAALEDRHPSVKAVLILRGGCEAFAYYRPGVDAGTRMPLHSMTKSVLSALLGLLIERGGLGLGERLSDLLPEAAAPGVDPRVGAVTIRQLLTMTAGLDAEAKPPAGMPPRQMWRWSLTRPLLSRPGLAFRYDNFGANLLSVILSRRTGLSAEAFARRDLFGPLGITDIQWLDDGEGHSVGAYGLWLGAPDMAKIGLLFLQHGRWRGRQVVPEAYVAAATHPQNAGGTPFRAAYGYLWWVEPAGSGPAAFFAAGSDGQLIYVVPTLDLVAVLASDKAPPGGGVAFMTDVLLPAVPASPCRPDR